MQRYRIRRRISQLRFLDSALLQPVCEVGRRRFVALRDELLGGPVGEQRLDFRTVLVQLAFAGAFRSSDRQTGSPSRAKKCQSAFNGDPLSASEYDPPPGGWDRWGGVRDPLLLSEVETTAQPDLFYADHPRLPFHRCTTKRSFCNQTRWVKLDADFPPSGSSLQAFPQAIPHTLKCSPIFGPPYG